MSNLPNLTPGLWTIDTVHSSVGFTVRHLMISKVRGSFSAFSGTIEVGDDLAQSKVQATVDLNSISTGDPQRDGHLRSADFFDTENGANMTFASTGFTVDGTEGTMSGDLTIRGITKPVRFDVEFGGVSPDLYGNTKAAFSGVTEINRKDFGIEWNAALEAGGVVVGDKVKIELEIQAAKK